MTFLRIVIPLISKDRDGQPCPPVEAAEVAVGRRVPARQARKREELDMDGQHAEHADAPEHVE